MLDTDIDALIVADMPGASVRVGKHNRRQVSEYFLADLLSRWTPDVAWIERVHALPGQGVTSSFSFGLSYGLVRGVLAGHGVPLSLVTPNEWKRLFRLSSDKNESRFMAARLFPTNAASFARVKDDGRAEASLLALFGARQNTT